MCLLHENVFFLFVSLLSNLFTMILNVSSRSRTIFRHADSQTPVIQERVQNWWTIKPTVSCAGRDRKWGKGWNRGCNSFHPTPRACGWLDINGHLRMRLCILPWHDPHTDDGPWEASFVKSRAVFAVLIRCSRAISLTAAGRANLVFQCEARRWRIGWNKSCRWGGRGRSQEARAFDLMGRTMTRCGLTEKRKKGTHPSTCLALTRFFSSSSRLYFSGDFDIAWILVVSSTLLF